MRIIMISQWYPPETETRIHMLASSLVELGHKVVVITGFPNYPTGKIFPGYSLKWRQWELIDGVRVLRVPLYPNHDLSTVKRIFNYVSFTLSATTIGASLCGQADVVWAYHPPLTVGLPTIVISKTRNIPFMLEIQDMWPETLMSTGLFKNQHGITLISKFANWLYSKSWGISVISKGFKKNLIDKGVPCEKIHVIPNWADENLYKVVEPNEELAMEYGFSGKFNIVYAGNMGAAQALQNVLKAAELLNDIQVIRFVLIGNGVEKQNLVQKAISMKLENVVFFDSQPACKMADFYALSEVLLVHLRDDPLFSITIPGKTTAYLACGKPIICSVAGDAAAMVQEAGAGITAKPEDPIDLARAVRQMFNLTAKERMKLGVAGRNSFEKLYSKSVLIPKYEQLFKEMNTSKKTRSKDL